MMRDVLRMIGFGCILAGGILYFTEGSQDVDVNEVQQLQDEVIKLKSVIAKTNKELAIAQTTSSTEKNSPKEDDKTEDNGNSILIIEPGSNSTDVSKALNSLGILQDAAAFDAYLADNGLSGKIQIGEHHLDSSMDFETIAKKITTVK